MSKQQIHAWVDSEIYLSLKTNKLNISATINKLLKEYININDENTGDIIKLREKIVIAKKQRDEKTEEISLLAVKISKLQDDKIIKDKKEFEETGAIIKGMLRAGVLR